MVEEDYQRLTRDEMTVWDSEHPRPESGEEYERKLCRQLADAANKQLDALTPTDEKSLAKWHEVVGGAFETIIGRRGLPMASDLSVKETEKVDGDGFVRYVGLLQNTAKGEELPMVMLRPAKWEGKVAIWLSDDGKAGLFGDDGAPKAEVKRLLDAGSVVLGVDLLWQGEFKSTDTGIAKNRPVKNPREFAGYTYGYNHALLAQRTHDVLSVIAFAKNHPPADKTISLIALDGSAPIAAAALALSHGTVQRAALDTQGFRFLKLTDYLDANFLPGAAKYGDLPGLLSLAAPTGLAPTKLWLAGETDVSSELVKKAYAARGAGDALTLAAANSDEVKTNALDWILKSP